MSTIRVLRVAFLIAGLILLATVLVFATQPSDFLIKIVSDVFPMVLSIAMAALAGIILWKNRAKQSGRRIWGSLTLGLLLWMIGEILWTYFDFAAQDEIPYPSLADAAWLLGYVPIAIGLFAQFLTLRAAQSRARLLFIGLASALMVAVTFWLVIQPILFNPEAGSPVEMFFDIAYPLGDTVLLMLGVALLFTFLGGRLALPWGVVAVGVLLLSVADLLFSYGTWNGFYYPDGQLNLFSGVFDTVYIVANMTWDFGLLLFLLLPETGGRIDLRNLAQREQQTAAQAESFLLMTDKAGLVVYLDPALVHWLGWSGAGEGMSRWFGDPLGINRVEAEEALRQASASGMGGPMTVNLGRDRLAFQLWIAGPEGGETAKGFELLLRPAADAAAAPPARESFLVDRFLYRRAMDDSAGQVSAQEQELRVYFDTLVIALDILLHRAGGGAVQAAFEGMLNVEAGKHKCGFEIQHSQIAWQRKNVPPAAYRAVLDTAIQYARDVVQPSTVDQLLSDIEKNLDSHVVLTAAENNLRIARSTGA